MIKIKGKLRLGGEFVADVAADGRDLLVVHQVRPAEDGAGRRQREQECRGVVGPLSWVAGARPRRAGAPARRLGQVRLANAAAGTAASTAAMSRSTASRTRRYLRMAVRDIHQSWPAASCWARRATAATS